MRQHSKIENGPHYRRDVTFQEDQLRSKAPAFGQMVACLNNLVIGLAHCLGRTNLPKL
ncbi:MAG: hypothetical protein ACRDH2_00775 [Anaerolineales bacterium]